MNNNGKLLLHYDIKAYFADLADILRVFFRCRIIESEAESADIVLEENGKGWRVSFCGSLRAEVYYIENSPIEAKLKRDLDENFTEDKKNADNKRRAKLALYRAAKSYTGFSPPWGALTGIRPTRFREQMLLRGVDAEGFNALFDLDMAKSELVSDVLGMQSGFKGFDEGLANLYIGVPFCVTKCSYCSFSGGLLKQYENLVEPYLDALIYEIKDAVDFLAGEGIVLKSVYIGGGTPTSLTAKQLERLFAVIPKTREFTVETGRPDTLTPEHVALFLSEGVTRVSVNPQTFIDKTLERVNRRHTAADVYRAYALVKDKLDVNMDLIAGLPGEGLEDFKYSLDSTAALRPQNITVHTLALKSGSALKEEQLNDALRLKRSGGSESNCGVEKDGDDTFLRDAYGNEANEVSKMVEYAYDSLKGEGYSPYYLYRQKYMSENLENAGYCLKGKQCGYNIDTMEETASIIACGASAISKRVEFPNKIERLANTKDVALYISRIRETVANKRALFRR